MAEKSKEELLDEFGRAAYSGKRDEAWNARAAVLARMCGPGEVVVPVVMTEKMERAFMDAMDADHYSTYGATGWPAALAARPNNGGNDDAAA